MDIWNSTTTNVVENLEACI